MYTALQTNQAKCIPHFRLIRQNVHTPFQTNQEKCIPHCRLIRQNVHTPFQTNQVKCILHFRLIRQNEYPISDKSGKNVHTPSPTNRCLKGEHTPRFKAALSPSLKQFSGKQLVIHKIARRVNYILQQTEPDISVQSRNSESIECT